jgi:hypothetical protein
MCTESRKWLTKSADRSLTNRGRCAREQGKERFSTRDESASALQYSDLRNTGVGPNSTGSNYHKPSSILPRLELTARDDSTDQPLLSYI